MFIKQVLKENFVSEIGAQIASFKYGFVPNIIDIQKDGENYLLVMEDMGKECLADKYGEDPRYIPEWIWYEIRDIVKTLFEKEGIEYRDISAYNFVEKDERIYVINFEKAKYVHPYEPTNWFVVEFLEGENSWNPDYK